MPIAGWEAVERHDPYYKACLIGSTAAGFISGVQVGAIGGVTAIPVALAGGVFGFVSGYFSCPYLAPRIRLKFEQGLPLSRSEMKDAAQQMQRYSGYSSGKDIAKLLAVVSANGKAASKKGSGSSLAPSYLAREILSGV